MYPLAFIEQIILRSHLKPCSEMGGLKVFYLLFSPFFFSFSFSFLFLFFSFLLSKNPSPQFPKTKLKDKDPRRHYIIKSPPNLIHFAIAGGARCLPYLTVFRDTKTLFNDLCLHARACLSNVFDVPDQVILF